MKSEATHLPPNGKHLVSAQRGHLVSDQRGQDLQLIMCIEAGTALSRHAWMSFMPPMVTVTVLSAKRTRCTLCVAALASAVTTSLTSEASFFISSVRLLAPPKRGTRLHLFLMT